MHLLALRAREWKMIPLRESALLVVDVQRGFTTLCPDELPVPGGLEIVPAINRLLALDWARIDEKRNGQPFTFTHNPMNLSSRSAHQL